MWLAILSGVGLVVSLTSVFLGYLFLIFSAFGKSVGWGLSVLIFFPSVIPFSLMNKEHASYGTGLLLKGLAGAVVCLIVIAVVIPKK